MAFCLCGTKQAAQTSRFVTIQRPPFGKMNKTPEQLFTCFLAAAERYRAPQKEGESELNALPAELREMNHLQNGQRADKAPAAAAVASGGQGNTILAATPEYA